MSGQDGARAEGQGRTLEQEERWAWVAWSFLAEPRSGPPTRLLEEPFDHYPVGGDAVLIRSGPGSDLYVAFIGEDRDRVVEVRIGCKPEVLNPEGCV